MLAPLLEPQISQLATGLRAHTNAQRQSLLSPSADHSSTCTSLRRSFFAPPFIAVAAFFPPYLSKKAYIIINKIHLRMSRKKLNL
jgi:hypothetical protein